MKKVVWGVLSTAKIGRERVLPGGLRIRLINYDTGGPRWPSC